MTDLLPPEAKSKAISYFEKMGKLNLLTGVMGINQLKRNQQEQQRNQEAESAWVRKTQWDDSGDEGEQMGDQNILGDVTNPAPIVIQGGGNGGTSLLTLALGAALGGGGIWLGQQLSKPVIPATQPAAVQQQIQPVANQDTTTTTMIGLGRIEDYLESGASK